MGAMFGLGMGASALGENAANAYLKKLKLSKGTNLQEALNA